MKFSSKIIMLFCIVLTSYTSYFAQNITSLLEEAKLLMNAGYTDSSKTLYIHASELANDARMPKLYYKAITSLAKIERTVNRDYFSSSKILSDASKNLNAINTESSIEEAKLYFDLGYSFTMLDDFFPAIGAYKKCATIRNALLGPNALDVASVWFRLGNLYTRLADWENAKRFHFKALNIRSEILGDDHILTSKSLMGLGIAYKSMGEFKQAESYYQKTLNIRKNNPSTSRMSLGSILVNIGTLKFEQKEYESSRSYFVQAIKLFDAKSIEGMAAIAEIYLNRAEIYSVHGEHKLAIQTLQLSLDLALLSYGKNKRETAQIYLALGDAYTLDHQANQAIQYLHLALSNYLPTYTDTNPHSLPHVNQLTLEPWIFVTLLSKANAYRKQFEMTADTTALRRGLDCIDLAIAQLRKVRASFQAEEVRHFMSNFTYDIFESGIALSHQFFTQNPDSNFLIRALNYSEGSRAISLMENLNELQNRNYYHIPKNYTDQAELFEKQINKYELRLYKVRQDDVSKKELEDSIFGISQAQQILHDSIQSKYPEYYAGKKQIAPIINVDSFQSALEPNELLIEYFWGDNSLYAWGLTSSDFVFHEIPNIDSIDSMIHSLRELVGQAPASINSKNDFQLFKYQSHQLYRALIQPITNLINKELNSLLIIPDGPLSLVPFEIYCTVDTAATAYNELPYLIRSTNIQYGNTIRQLQYDQNKDSLAQKELLAVAPVFNTKKNEIPHSNYSQFATRDFFGPLPETLKEVRSIATILNTDTLFHDCASEYETKKQIESYRIIHFATHAFTDDNNVNYSGIIFSTQTDTIDDGFLYTYEVEKLNLNADLVVLSACNTGLGKSVKGEGLMSLSRAFMKAGCPATIVSLWQAQDRSTSLIMQEFYSGLSKGLAKDEALRKAKLQYLDGASGIGAHPWYWAGFVSFGDKTPLYSDNFIFYFLLIGTVLLIALINWLNKKS